MIADPIVAPEARWFAEKLIYLDCYMPTDGRKHEPVHADEPSSGCRVIRSCSPR